MVRDCFYALFWLPKVLLLTLLDRRIVLLNARQPRLRPYLHHGLKRLHPEFIISKPSKALSRNQNGFRPFLSPRSTSQL